MLGLLCLLIETIRLFKLGSVCMYVSLPAIAHNLVVECLPSNHNKKDCFAPSHKKISGFRSRLFTA